MARQRQTWRGSPFCILFENWRAQILELSATARTNCGILTFKCQATTAFWTGDWPCLPPSDGYAWLHVRAFGGRRRVPRDPRVARTRGGAGGDCGAHATGSADRRRPRGVGATVPFRAGSVWAKRHDYGHPPAVAQGRRCRSRARRRRTGEVHRHVRARAQTAARTGGCEEGRRLKRFFNMAKTMRYWRRSAFGQQRERVDYGRSRNGECQRNPSASAS